MSTNAGSVNDQPLADSAIFSCASPQRILATGGILLIIAGLIFGDIFAVFILHPNNARIGQALFDAAQAVAAQDAAAVLTQFQAIGGFLENRGTKVDAHSHIINFGYLAIMLALAQPYVALSRQHKIQLAKLFLVGAVLLPPSVFLIHYVGLVYSPLESIGWASIAADVGGLFIILACIGQLVGLCRYAKGDRTVDEVDYVLNCNSWESRLLLKGGALLLLVGFLFGAFYAAANFEQIAAQEIVILSAILEQSAAQDMAAVADSFAGYGSLMAEKAIKIATHAHANEVGILLLLLAFIQPFIYWSEQWRRRWATVMVVGAIGLPIAILFELKYGLLAGGFADSAGLLLIISLFAMLFGVLRHTGRLDAEEGVQ